MRKDNPFSFYAFIATFFIALVSIGSIIARHQSMGLFLAYGTSFFAYVFLLQEKHSFKTLLGLGILVRLSFFFHMPSLSDDIYRFIWDGTLLTNGIHPFDQLPAFYLNQQPPGNTQELFDKLNSPEYFTVYPPINQFIFWISATIGNGHWLVSANSIRLLLLLADLGSFWFLIQLLKRCEKPPHLVFWFFLNPLVILEFVGNLHFEGFVVLFVLAGIHWFENTKKAKSGISFGLAVGTKLLPLIFLPFLFLSGLRNRKWSIAIISGLVALASLLPLINESFIQGMQTSLNLYFQKFEFNASVYFIVREIGYWQYGYNRIAHIGPLLSKISVVLIMGISVLGFIKKWPIPKALLFILSTYLLLATTVHPWYILPLIVLGILSGYYYPIVWSLMIFVTYLGYSDSGFDLPITWVIVEYLVVLTTLILELRFRNRLLKFI